MDTSLENSQYTFPYFWTLNSKEIIFDNITGENFKHLHIEGEAGVGKSRCLFEVQNHLSHSENVLLINYFSGYEVRNKKTILNTIAKALSLKSSLSNADINESNACDAVITKSLSKHVVIAIEDLHYEDDIRDSFINKIIYKCEEEDCNVTLITTSRKNFHLMKSNTFQTIKLNNLSSSDASSLIDCGCKNNATLKMLRKNILTKSDGNPLYISEAMNIVIQATKDPFFDLNPSDFFKLTGLDDLYKMLLSTFNDAQKEILKAASTIGKTFHCDDLLYLLPYYKDYLVDILEDLCKKKFLIAEKDGPKYSFIHDRQLENIYRNIDLNEKKSWHIALFQNYKKSRNHALCGYHLYHARKYQDAIPYLTYTARKSLKNAQPKKAEMYFLKAFYAMERSGLALNESYLKLKIDYCQSLLMQGDVNKLRPIIANLTKNDAYNNINSFKKYFLKIEITFKWISNEFNKPYVIDKLSRISNQNEAYNEKLRLSGMLVDLGCYREAISYMNDFNNILVSQKKYFKDSSFTPMALTLHAHLANAYAQTGDTENMDISISTCLKLIRNKNKPAQRIFGLAFCAKALQAVDRYKEATPLIEEAHKLNQDAKIGIVTPDILSIYADNLMHRDEFFKAFFLFDNLMNIIYKKGIEANKSLHLAHQAHAYYMFGLKKLPKDLLLSAIDLADKQGNFYQKSYASYILAKIYFETGDLEQGTLYSEYAIRITKEINAISLFNSIELLVRKYVVNNDLTVSKH